MQADFVEREREKICGVYSLDPWQRYQDPRYPPTHNSSIILCRLRYCPTKIPAIILRMSLLKSLVEVPKSPLSFYAHPFLVLRRPSYADPRYHDTHVSAIMLRIPPLSSYADPAIILRRRYTMSGTERGYAATRRVVGAG
eukprot:3358057-Rhodomonas_salina.2